MVEKKDTPKSFSGTEALVKAREGKEVWNAWAAKNKGLAVDFSGVDFSTEENKNISFAEFTFPGDAYFLRAKFQKAIFTRTVFTGYSRFDEAIFAGDAKFTRTEFADGADFVDATFKKEAGFTWTAFNGDAWFVRATFLGRADFTRVAFATDAFFIGAIFAGRAGFTGSTFIGPASLEGCQFGIIPDFRRSEFRKHITLHGVDIKFKQPSEASDVDKYRRLKQLAFDARDHDREQFFFACELRAKRGHETQGLALIPNYLYEWTSDFGRSVLRPTFGLFAVWVAFADHYRWLANKDLSFLWDGLILSATHLIPFVSVSKNALDDSRRTLFGDIAAPLINWLNAMGIVEGLLGFVFLFLIGLALRNRFRI